MRPMKDSGVEWIGDIPENWDVHFVKYAFSEVKNKNYDGKEKNALKFTNGEIVKKENFKADEDEYIADTILNYTVVNPNTIMINGLNLNYDLKSLRVGIVPERGIITSAYLALEPDEQKIYPQYANLLFKGYESKMALHNMGVGIRLTLGYKEFKRQPILVPPLYEQYKIAGFLKLKCSEIDTVISKTNVSIEEYKRLKQAIITKAVTKGIRGNRPMKDSGIEWIGEIPSDWECKKAKYCVKITNGSDPVTEGDIPVYGSGADSFKTCGEYKVGPAVLIGRKGATLHIPHYIEGKYWNVDTAFDVKARKQYWLKYYYYCACSFDYKFYISQTTLPGMTQTNYGNMVLPFPIYAEQHEIAEYLDSKCMEIDKIIGRKQQLITELEAYKKSLIYEYVTGKKEVV